MYVGRCCPIGNPGTFARGAQEPSNGAVGVKCALGLAAFRSQLLVVLSVSLPQTAKVERLQSENCETAASGVA